MYAVILKKVKEDEVCMYLVILRNLVVEIARMFSTVSLP